MDKLPQISVIMSVYNEPIEWVKESINSILNQTYNDFEFIIVNDNPARQENEQALKEYADLDSRVVVISNDQNIGLTKSLNKALEISKGIFIARMDADDIAFPNRLEKQYEFLALHADIDVLASNVYEFYNNIKDKKLINIPPKDRTIKKSLIFITTLYHPSVLLRKFTLSRLNIKYDEKYRRSQDYNLWLTLALNGAKFASIPKPLLYYRSSPQQTSKINVNVQTEDRNNIYREFVISRLSKIHIETEKVTTKEILNLYNAQICIDSEPFDRVLLFRLYLGYCFSNKVGICKRFYDSLRYKMTLSQALIIILSYFSARWKELQYHL